MLLAVAWSRVPEQAPSGLGVPKSLSSFYKKRTKLLNYHGSLLWTLENMSRKLRVYGLLISIIFEFRLLESDKPGFQSRGCVDSNLEVIKTLGQMTYPAWVPVYLLESGHNAYYGILGWLDESYKFSNGAWCHSLNGNHNCYFPSWVTFLLSLSVWVSLFSFILFS